MSYIVPYGGERLDIIARLLLGTEQSGAVEALLIANRGLAAKCEEDGTVPEYTEIAIPADFVPKAEDDGIVLAWE